MPGVVVRHHCGQVTNTFGWPDPEGQDRKTETFRFDCEYYSIPNPANPVKGTVLANLQPLREPSIAVAIPRPLGRVAVKLLVTI